MSIAEEQLDEEMPVRNPQHLSAAIRKYGQGCLEEESGEDFNFEEVDDSSSSESTVSVVLPTQGSKVCGDV